MTNRLLFLISPTRSRSVPLILPLVLSLLCAPVQAQTAGSESAEVESAQAAEVSGKADRIERHEVKRGELVRHIRAAGRLESDQQQPLVFRPQAYSGTLKVRSVKQRAGAVDIGQPIIQLEAPDYDDALRQANESLADAQKRLAWAERELSVLIAQQQMNEADWQVALDRAIEDAKRWEAVESADMLKKAELDMQAQIDRLHDQQQELEQLKELYEGSKLADRTQDIVLERTKRRLKRAEEAFEIAKNEHEKITEIAYPRRDADVQRNLERKKLESEHGREQWAITVAKKRLEVEQATRAVRAASEKLVELEADFEALCIKAEQRGLVTGVNVKPGDIVQAAAPLGRIVDPEQPMLRVQLSPTDLLAIEQGAEVDLRLPAVPHVQLTGRVRSVDLVGQPSGEGTVFPATITVNQTHPLARLGMKCEVRAKHTIADVITLPKRFIKLDEDSGQAYCRVATDDGGTRRRIVQGLGNGEAVEIVEGLEPGDIVLSQEVE